MDSASAAEQRQPLGSSPSDRAQLLLEINNEYHWPGNVRELENVIERAVILARGPNLEIPLNELKTTSESPATVRSEKGASPSTLESVGRDHILRILEETNWVVAGPEGAAARLGMKRTTLQARMQKLGITRRGRTSTPDA